MSDSKKRGGGTIRRRIVGIFFLFSGAALLMKILGGVSLPVALTGTVTVAIGGAAYLWRRLDPLARSQLRVRMRVGTVAGITAIVAYDATKWGLAVLDPSSFDPFGAIPTFGALFVGTSAPPTWTTAVGIGYHVLNGLTFAVAYSIMFGHRGVLAGVGWGIFLEIFQFTLYPGWLNINAFYAEFVTVSFLGHAAYGATLGYVCKRELARPMSGGGYRPEKNK